MLLGIIGLGMMKMLGIMKSCFVFGRLILVLDLLERSTMSIVIGSGCKPIDSVSYKIFSVSFWFFFFHGFALQVKLSKLVV